MSTASFDALHIYLLMSGITLQKITKIKDSAAVIKKRLEEEENAKPLAYGSLKVSELAELLGGAAREPYFLGSGWEGSPGEGVDPTDPNAVALALETGARANTRVRAYGVILTLPKSASLLAAFDQDDPEHFKKILGEMASECMRVLENDSVVRFGNGGYDKVPVRGLKAWAVIHAASAGGDPHWHVHLIISATAETIDERKGQIDGDKLFRETARLADGSAKRIMAQRLEKLGYGIGLDGDVVGVDRELIERASTARNAVQAIRTFFASRGIALSDKTAWDRWRQVAEGKPEKTLSGSLLESIGIARGEKLGGEAIEHAIDEALSYPKRRTALRDWFALKYKISNWKTLGDKARKAWREYPFYDDVTKVVALMAMLPTPPTPASVEGLCARFTDDDHRADLMDRVGRDPRVLKGEKHWALTSQLVRERKIVEQTEKLMQKECSELGIEELLVDEELPLCVIQGVAGAGKSEALRAASKRWKKEGKTVWAVARNRLTATDTGTAVGASKRHTLSSYALRELIARSQGPRPGDILVVDEFALLNHADVEMMLSLAEKGVLVKVLGDSHQIQPIDSSTSARLVMDIARKHDMVSLDHSRRCESWKVLHDSLREVVTGESDPKEIIDDLEIRAIESPDQAVEIAKGHRGAEIAVQSNDLRCVIAEQLQRPNQPKHLRQVCITKDGNAAWAGDKVVIRKNITATSRSGEEVWLYNGQRARVAQVSRGEVALLTDAGLAKISHEAATEALSLGGVWTGDSAQGQTWEKAVVVLTGTETREWLYSAVARGRDAPVIAVLSDDGEDPKSIVEAVLSREGIAKTVDEMCKKDAELANSVREAEARWSGSSGGGSSASVGSDPLAKPETEQLVAPLEETAEIVQIDTEPDEACPAQREEDPAKTRWFGFFCKGADGIWRVDLNREFELRQSAREKLGLGPALGPSDLEQRIERAFTTKIRREIPPGSGEFYDPLLDEGNERYIPEMTKALRDDQFNNTDRVYAGKFFYKNSDGIWCVDYRRRNEIEARAFDLAFERSKRGIARGWTFDSLDELRANLSVDRRRPVSLDENDPYHSEIYDPGLDPYASALNAARKRRDAEIEAEADARARKDPRMAYGAEERIAKRMAAERAARQESTKSERASERPSPVPAPPSPTPNPPSPTETPTPTPPSRGLGLGMGF